MLNSQTDSSYVPNLQLVPTGLTPPFLLSPLHSLSKRLVFSQSSHPYQANSAEKEAGPPANLHGAQQQTQQFISYIHPQKICSSWFTLTKHEMQNPGLAT